MSLRGEVGVMKKFSLNKLPKMSLECARQEELCPAQLFSERDLLQKESWVLVSMAVRVSRPPAGAPRGEGALWHTHGFLFILV